MTLTEIRRTILESGFAKELNSIEENFIFPYVNTTINLKGVSSIYEFVIKQIEGWEKYGQSIPSELLYSKQYFTIVQNQIISFVINFKTQNYSGDISHYWKNNVGQYIQNVRQFPLKYNSAEVEFLLKVFQDYPNSFVSSFNFIVGNNNYNVNSREGFIGVLLAYEFIIKDASKIVKRANLDKSAFRTIRNDLEQQFSQSENDLVEHLRQTNERYQDYIQLIDELKNAKEKQFDGWFTQAKTDFENFDSISKNNVTSLENTYEEILRLKKPADYWKSRAEELNKDGWNYLKYLIGLIVLSVIILYSILWLTPDEMLKSFFNNDKSSAIRWSIIFITLISFLAFGIKLLTKITFSTFHLSRDAEERERLTYVYLAMVKDASIDKEDRHLVMQSLFSRADTGLLKDDGTPTMPGANSLIEKTIK